ncbi:unnamed protein product [Mytilus coruscus]|uniref:Uncharacterized protein n=1 Tax=Mytilus coruscus TaxID=42192 RepID=A0A6J8CNV9_MYTCO|nr:unnamed protein product [Mytilus coruscus]
MSSSKNTCQAVLKPDGSKNMTNKSAGVKKALMNLIKRCLQSDTATNQKLDSSNNELNNLILTDFTTLPLAIQQSGVISIVEFAGTKFKVFATSGQQYLNYISNGIVKKLLNYLPSLERIIICEEKYAFTPNDFKANTRQKRKKKEKVTISHLKEDQEIVSSENFSKQAVVGTMAGKILISLYLATQMQHLKIKADLEINVDSEAYTSKCNCQKEHDESCSRYTVPVRVMYNKQTGYVKEGFIDEVKQRKGEAEMAQADWLLDADIQKSLGNGKCVVNYVTSADIDTVVIHILAVSQFWPRNEDNTFKYPVYLILQKKKPELFNITGLLTLFEKTYNRNIGLTIACVLSMGGNDFLPNFHGISHDHLLSEVLKDEDLRNNLVTVSREEHQLHLSKRFLLNTNMYICLYKRMYCPSNLKNELLSLEEIRQLTIKPPNKDFKHPQNWMPPKTALQQLGKLVQCKLDYFETIGRHDASLPNFISKGCLSKLDDGSIQIELGSETFIQDQKSLITIEENILKEKLRECQQSDNKKSRATKRRLLDTPQKGKSGKRVQTQSTPSNRGSAYLSMGHIPSAIKNVNQEG